MTLARHGLVAITRLRLDAALYEPAPFLADRNTRWTRVTVPGWYGEGEREVEICSAPRSGAMLVCWSCRSAEYCCAIPLHRFAPQALLCTDPAREPLPKTIPVPFPVSVHAGAISWTP